MAEQIAERSPLIEARIAGFLYLLSILTGMTGAIAQNRSLSVAANLIGTGCYVAVTLILYDLLKPVNKGISMLAAFFSLAGCAITILKLLHLPAPGVSSLVFFGCYCLLLAYLIWKSSFLPQLLSVLLAITGLGWLTYLSPALAERLFVPYLMTTGLIGEGALTLWLLIFGVNARRWMEQSRSVAAAAGIRES